MTVSPGRSFPQASAAKLLRFDRAGQAYAYRTIGLFVLR
jgi:hypothetical protein